MARVPQLSDASRQAIAPWLERAQRATKQGYYHSAAGAWRMAASQADHEDVRDALLRNAEDCDRRLMNPPVAQSRTHEVS